jgi:SAM-dependent methyltransferase
MRWRLRLSGSPSLVTACDHVTNSADLPRVQRLHVEMADVLRHDPVSAAKYTDYEYWLPLNVQRVADLGLHVSPALKILDIGAGPGYFLAAARAFGHDAYGVDVPESFFTDVERRVYSELLAAFGNAERVSPLLIQSFRPLPYERGSFDMITAFWICFNRHGMPDEWGVEEWRFFVEDARRILRPGGRLCLELNQHVARYGELAFYDAPTLAYFESVGTVNGARITIRAASRGAAQ